MKNTFSIGAFAARAGVTVRTIRYYDQIGLLKPSGHTPTGRRRYSERDYIRLQQILTLKLIGLSLQEIRSLLHTDMIEPGTLLEQQKQALARKAVQITRVIAAIEQAQARLKAADGADWQQFIDIIRVVNMEQQTNWLAQFLTAAQQQQLHDHQGQPYPAQKQTGEAWRNLFTAIQQHRYTRTTDPAVQQLVRQWDALMHDYALADAALAEQLNQAYAQLDAAPGMDEAPLADWAEAARFIQQARQVS